MTNFKKLTSKTVHAIISTTIKIEDFDLDNILIDEKSHQNILVYNILYQSLIDSKPLCTRCLKSFGSEKYEYINPF